MDGLADIGARNAGFAQRFLSHESIRVKGGSFSGDRRRCIQFWPVSGRARQAFLTPTPTPSVDVVCAARAVDGGSVEFF
jgi:chemotaxis protein CheD